MAATTAAVPPAKATADRVTMKTWYGARDHEIDEAVLDLTSKFAGDVNGHARQRKHHERMNEPDRDGTPQRADQRSSIASWMKAGTSAANCE